MHLSVKDSGQGDINPCPRIEWIFPTQSTEMPDLFFKNFDILKLLAPVIWASLTAQLVKNPPAMQETLVWFLGCESSGEGKDYPLHYSGLENSTAWRSPWVHNASGRTFTFQLLLNRTTRGQRNPLSGMQYLYPTTHNGWNPRDLACTRYPIALEKCLFSWLIFSRFNEEHICFFCLLMDLRLKSFAASVEFCPLIYSGCLIWLQRHLSFIPLDPSFQNVMLS